MLCIDRKETNPYFNIATEEYAFHHFRENVFMLWQSMPCIVIGKHQNAYAEINHDYVKEKNIPVIRRISGGGTVYHDLGNLNYSLIIRGKKGKLVNYKRYTEPIIQVLKSLGVDARLAGKSDIKINGEKISGNAEHLFKDRVLHHGTLLFSTCLGELHNALKPVTTIYSDKAVKSNRSTVTNIREHLTDNINIDHFKSLLLKQIQSNNIDCRMYSLSNEDKKAINELVKKKYLSWDWNYGYSPDYRLKKTVTLNETTINVALEIRKGIITNAEINSKPDNTFPALEIKKLLIGIPHGDEMIQTKLSQLISLQKIDKNNLYTFIRHLF